MRIQRTKKALILIYILFLVTITIVFSTILINNNSFLFNISRYHNVESKLFSNINSDASILIRINNEVNSNGGWFVDAVSCPNILNGWVTMTKSWSLWVTIDTFLAHSWTITYCEGVFDSNPLTLYFNTWLNELVIAEYLWYIITVSAWVWVTDFWDTDYTTINFSTDNYTSRPDLIDDDYDSDNYRVNSSWAVWLINSNYYPNLYQDDDVLWRMQLFGYVAQELWFKKVFWNTPKVLEIIEGNYNNWDYLNTKIWDVTDGILHFDVDKSFDIRIIEIDKNIYNESNELKILSRIDWSMWAWVWYLHDTAWVLFLSWSNTGDVKKFDFANNLYAIFIEDTWTGTLLYKITWEDSTTWSWMYITPIDDSDKKIIRYIWNEILISETWRYITKETELIFEK